MINSNTHYIGSGKNGNRQLKKENCCPELAFSLKKTQNWAIGQMVNVGFLKGLKVLSVKAIKDGKPDIYTLLNEKNGNLYEFTPHNGLNRVN